MRLYGLADLDLLQIDVEGAEWKILKSIPFEKFKPSIIHYEYVHLSQKDNLKCIRMLEDYGYTLLFDNEDVTAYLPST